MAGLLAALEDAGKASISDYEALYASHAGDPGFAFEVVEALASGVRVLERGGGWMLRKWLEAGGELDAEQRHLLLSAFDTIESWEGRLSLCRLLCVRGMADRLGLSEVALFLRDSCQHDVPFVRAWALSAFCQLARDQREYLAEAKTVVREAKGRECAKSVRARLRKIDSILDLDE